MKIYLKRFVLCQVTIIFAFACFALPPQARAVCQEGCLTLFNTALGEDALINNTSGGFNTAIGFNALLNNFNSYNTAIGYSALSSNIDGYFNTATGYSSLRSNTSGIYNTATGLSALFSNTTGDSNTANGVLALSSNTGGFLNTATGVNALGNNTTGNNNKHWATMQATPSVPGVTISKLGIREFRMIRHIFELGQKECNCTQPLQGFTKSRRPAAYR